MAHYRVLLHGRNLLLELDGKVQRLGFYVTRFVEAPSPVEAECRALGELQQEPRLRSSRNRADDPPFIDVAECAPIARSAVPKIAPGYALFLADETDAA